MLNDVAISFVERCDLGQLVKLCEKHAAYEKSTYSLIGKEKRLGDHLFGSAPSLQCLVAKRQSTVVAYATFMKQFSTWESEHYLYLDCLFLEESVRGLGLGGKMMNEVAKYADEQNCLTIQWQTPTFNQKAIAFYKKLGAIEKRKARFFWCIE
ncbi:MAG: GNAT family N-acetyltransferase [Bacteroidota bacterium]